MPFSTTTLTLGLASGAVSGNSSPITVTLKTTDYPSAMRFVSTALQGGGILADNGTFYPADAVLSSTVTSYQ